MFRDSSYPRKWSEMSTDFKLMMGYHLCMMALFIVGGAVGVVAELAIAASVFAIAIAISVWRKLAVGWRWPGVGFKGIAWALVGIALMAVFAFAATPLASPTSPVMLPWYLGIAGFGIFNTANALRLATLSEAEFLTQCGEHQPTYEREQPREARWRSVVRNTYSVVFTAVWLVGVASFYFFGVGMRDGAPSPTGSRTEQLTNHGHTVYISAAEKNLIDLLQISMFVGIPAIMIGGALLHFVFKIPVFGFGATKK
jgi:hypothetical protein